MTHAPMSGIPRVVREPEYDEPLDPTRLRLFRDASGQLRMTIADDRSYLDVKLAYAFPLSATERYIGILDGRDRSIGLIENLEGLDPTSRTLVEESLQRRYFVPEILRIQSLREQFGVVYFDVETDRGPRSFVVRGLRDSIEILDNGHVLIADVDGNRYKITRWQSLDTRSRRLIEDFI